MRYGDDTDDVSSVSHRKACRDDDSDYVTVFEAASLTVSEKNTETMMFRTPSQEPHQEPLVVEATCQNTNRRINLLIWAGF